MNFINNTRCRWSAGCSSHRRSHLLSPLSLALRGGPSGNRSPRLRIWAIAASLIYILIFAGQFIILLQEPWYQHVGALFIGIVWLVLSRLTIGRAEPSATVKVHWSHIQP